MHNFKQLVLSFIINFLIQNKPMILPNKFEH